MSALSRRRLQVKWSSGASLTTTYRCSGARSADAETTHHRRPPPLQRRPAGAGRMLLKHTTSRQSPAFLFIKDGEKVDTVIDGRNDACYEEGQPTVVTSTKQYVVVD